jgi:hypothetical protein
LVGREPDVPAPEDPRQETVELAIGSISNALDLLGNVYNDVRDALNEFVSNAYDEIVLGRVPSGTVQVTLMPKGKPPRIMIRDNGRGISREDLIRIAKSIANSAKPVSATPSMQVIGEKGIGILGFQTLAERCQIITRHESGRETLCLELTKGKSAGSLRTLDRGNLLEIPGTEVHLLDIDERTFRVLTLPKLVEYFRERWRRPLASDTFSLIVVHGNRSERVRPGKFEGQPFFSRVRTEFGFVESELYLSPRTQARKRVEVMGVGGVQIVPDITLDPEFDRYPWNSDQVQGEIRFAALKQTTGRRGVQRDRRFFPAFAGVVQGVEPQLTALIERLNREQESQVDSRFAKAIREAFRKALSEIEALSTVGLRVKIADPAGALGEGTLFESEVAATAESPGPDDGSAPENGVGPSGEGGDGGDAGGPEERPGPKKDLVEGPGGRARQSTATGLNYRPIAFEDSTLRSRYNEALRTIEINKIHPDYMRARDHDRRAFLDYLVLLVAKELALLNYQGIDQGELLEKYAELLARVQLHLPKRV